MPNPVVTSSLTNAHVTRDDFHAHVLDDGDGQMSWFQSYDGEDMMTMNDVIIRHHDILPPFDVFPMGGRRTINSCRKRLHHGTAAHPVQKMERERKRKSPGEAKGTSAEEAKMEKFRELVKSVEEMRRRERTPPKVPTWTPAFEWEDFGLTPPPRGKERSAEGDSGLDLCLRL